VYVHSYIVDLNRELSSLLPTSIESISRRSPRPPPLSRDLTWSPRTTIHTTKVLAAIEKMNALLTLPTHLSLHTPFIICMISNTAIAHLAAYKWGVYADAAGPRLAIERERIRLVVAVLKRLSGNWPLGRRTYREVVTIARDVLGNEGGGATAVGFEGLEGLNLAVGGFMGEEGFGGEAIAVDVDVDVSKEGECSDEIHCR